MHPSFINTKGHLLAAVDVETTGIVPGYHEIIQVAVQPVDSYLDVYDTVRPFYLTIAPEHPERAQKGAKSIHGLDLEELATSSYDKWRVADKFEDWWSDLGLPYKKTLVPIAQNWQFEAGFLKAWLGVEAFSQYFHAHARDTMITAVYINDRYAVKGLDGPFKSVNLVTLCNYFGVVNERPHDALADARAEAEVYKHLLRMII